MRDREALRAMLTSLEEAKALLENQILVIRQLLQAKEVPAVPARVSVYRMENGAVINTDKAQAHWDEDTWWNGSNYISKATGSQWEHQTLYKSRKGRYYILFESNWENTPTRAEWVSMEEAARWLLANNYYDLPKDLVQLAEEIEE
jgi:hypothetical protein